MRLRVLAAVLILGGCSGSGAPPGVPTLGGAPSTSAGTVRCLRGADGSGPATGGKADDGYHPTCTGATGEARRNALHAAAECIRQHGIPAYQDPVLTATGNVYTDARSIDDADHDTVVAAGAACREAILAADLVPDGQAPAPPKLVQAGVRSAQCMRDNGLRNVTDPDADTPFTPGHGFGVNASEVPGGKIDPTVQHALEACQPAFDEEARLSSLGSLTQ